MYSGDETSNKLLLQLLDPKGPLMATLMEMSLQDPSLRYELDANNLFHSQNLYTMIKGQEIPQWVEGKLVERSGKTFIHLDPTEYFLLSFVSLIQSPCVSSRMPLNTSRSIQFCRHIWYSKWPVVQTNDSQPLLSTLIRWQQDEIAERYLSILQNYLHFLLEKENLSLLAGNTHYGVKLCEFFFGIIGELWLSVNYSVDPSGRLPVSLSNSNYKLPSADILIAVNIVVQHICQIFYKKLSGRNRPEYLDRIFGSFRIHLYKFLRVYICLWPHDSSFAILGSIWLNFIAPWQYIHEEKMAERDLVEFWSPFVINNYLFYSELGLAKDYGVFGWICGLFEDLVDIDISKTLYCSVCLLHSLLVPVLSFFISFIEDVIIPFSSVLSQVERNHSLNFSKRKFEDPISDQLAVLEPKDFHYIPTMLVTADKTFVIKMLYLLNQLSSNLSTVPSDSSDKERHEILRYLCDGYDLICRAFSISITECSSAFEEAAAEIERNNLSHKVSKSIKSQIFNRRILPQSISDSRIDQVKKLKSLGRSSIIQSYESPLLLYIFTGITSFLNECISKFFAHLKSHGVDVPMFIVQNFRINLRWLAVIQNWFFLGFLAILCKLLTRIFIY